MPPPTDMEGVQRLNGFVNYLAKFLPKLSETMEPIRQLMRNDVPWNWAAAQQQAFEDVKKLVTNAPILSYYDSKKPLMIQCDASEKGLGAALLQEGQPIAFASRALILLESLHDSRPMLSAGSSSVVELFQVFMGTGLWQDGADQQVCHGLFIPTFARCLSILVESPFLHEGFASSSPCPEAI